jgi:5-methylcytosine-specific restriction protein A
MSLDIDIAYCTIVSAAKEGRFLTYGELAKAQDVDWGRYRNQIFMQLSRLLRISKERNWPYITSIVVTKEGLGSGELAGAALEGFVNDLLKLGEVVTSAASFVKLEQQKTFDWAGFAPDHLPEDAFGEAAVKYGGAAPVIEVAEKSWTDLELMACLAAYLEMLANEKNNETYSKARANRRLREGPLASRSKGSVEFRMQNISAFLESKRLPTIKGYKPLGNIGPAVLGQLDHTFSQIGFEELDIYGTTFLRDELEKRVRKLRGTELLVKPLGNPKPRKKETSTTSYSRSPQVVAYVIESAGGKCELCQAAAPFLTTDGSPFLEVHHVKPLADEGPDVVENAAALCPNCHRACHFSVDRQKLRALLLNRVDRLQTF